MKIRVPALPLCIFCALCANGLALATDLTSTTLSATNTAVRFQGANVANLTWIDARGVLPAAATITVYRTYSTGTDTVATVTCADGVGRGAPNSANWYILRNEYLKYTGSTNAATVRVIAAP